MPTTPQSEVQTSASKVAPLQKFVEAMSSFTSKKHSTKKEAVILEVGPSGSVNNGSQMFDRRYNIQCELSSSYFPV
jgi:hypothetical protein